MCTVCGGKGCGSGEEGRWARGRASYVIGAYTHRDCGSRSVVVCAFQVGGVGSFQFRAVPLSL